MATFSEIQVRVSKRLIDTSNTAVPLENVKEAINEAVTYWKFRRFWFNESESSGLLVAQDPVIPLPDDFLVEIPDLAGFVVSYSNMRYPLLKRGPWQYDNTFLDNGYGIPQVYARMNPTNQYHCYPIPDQAYTIIIRYLKEYAALVNDDDTNDFTTYADQLIMYEALGRLTGELRQDEKMEAYYRAAADREYNNLQVMTRKANASGFTAVHSIL